MPGIACHVILLFCLGRRSSAYYTTPRSRSQQNRGFKCSSLKICEANFSDTTLKTSKERPALFSFGIAIDDRAFDLLDQIGDRNTARAGVGAVENGAAAPDAVAVAQNLQTLGSSLVAAIEDEAVGVDDGSGSDPIGITPDRGAGAGTGTAENTLGAFVVARAVLLALQALGTGIGIMGDQVGLDGLILLHKGVHIDDQVLDHRIAQHWLDCHLLTYVADQHFARQAIAPVNTHGAGAAHAMGAGTPVGQRAIHSPLDCVERVEQAVNWIGLDAELIPVRLAVLLWIEAFDTHQDVHSTISCLGAPP